MTLFLTLLLPILLGVLLNTYSTFTLVSIPLHSFLEATGAFAAISMAIIVFMMYRPGTYETMYRASFALIVMGVFDGFHAMVYPGQVFVWLHSIAVFSGGVFFSLVWFSKRCCDDTNYRLLPAMLFAGAVIIALVSIIYPQMLPAMLDESKEFTLAADLLNITGGLFFMAAALYFIKEYRTHGHFDDLLFAGHTLLFGTSGLLFFYSSIWDAQWWLWHVLRFIAYMIALYYMIELFFINMRKLDRTQKKLQWQKEQLEHTLEIVDLYVITSSTDIRGTITEASSAFCEISGYSKEELIGRKHNLLRHPDMPTSLYDEMWRELKAGNVWRGEIKNRRKDGSSYWVFSTISPQFNEAHRIVGYSSIREDITDKKRVEELSLTDPLTSLANRRRLDTVIESELARAERYGKPLSVIMADIDHFKRINDSCGHEVGDLVLRNFSSILREKIRQSDIAGRWGGEEFLIVLPETTLDDAVYLAEKLRLEAQTQNYEGVSWQVSASFGVAALNGDSWQELIRRADDALYRAKNEGRNRVCTV